MLKIFLLLLTFFVLALSYAQRGKDLSYTVSSASTQLNAYTNVTANITAGNQSISVTNNALTNTFFTNPLAPGDLIMIIQMQGATLDIDPILVSSGFPWTTPYGHNFDWWLFKELWGQVTSYNNAGKYELAEVLSVTGATTITLQCGLKNNYTSSGHVQVVRVPRLVNLTLNPNTSVVPAAWNGTTGGVLALEVNGNLTFGANSRISATGFGFRGGITDNLTLGSPPGNINDNSLLGTPDDKAGAEKGEGIGGWTSEYIALSSRYGRGAPGNAGGGGGNHNSGGGGGSNVGTGMYTGDGNPQPGYNAIWELESAGFSAATSSGGGRGGYSYSTSDQNETVLGPKNALWGGDYRRNIGGLGGHPLTVDPTRIFAGGGGGAGDQNYPGASTTHGGNGGAGGGIVYLTLYGTTSGTAIIEANGAPGQHANPNSVAAGLGQKVGNDAAGGAGGGGAIVISNGTGIPATISLNANGGNGGNQNLSIGSFATSEADGPGGGGAGGMIAITSGSATQSVTGGNGGTTNSVQVNQFPPNGATNAAAGISGLTHPFFDINANNASLCSSGSTTLTATVIGTLPGGAAVTWYNAPFGGSVIGTGLTYNTGFLTTTTTVYVGTCPGTFRKPVTVTIGGPVITGTVVITDVTCSTPGSVTGLNTSGGTPAITISWNGVVTPGIDLTNASAGTYNVLVTDGSGCTATAGPFTIGTSGGPTINTTSMSVVSESCLGNDGSITGITTTGSITGISWNSGAYSTLDLNNVPSGNYTLVVTDNVGCTASAGPITVGLNPGPSISTTGMAIVNETCSNANGSITGITTTGGTLTYEWNGIAVTGTDLNGIAAGSYTLVVENTLGCTATAGPFTLTNTVGPTISTIAMTITDEHCSSGNGSISGIQIVGGTSPYTVSWNSGAYNTLNINSLAANVYSLSVADANGCIATAGPFTVTNISGPVINTTAMVITPESCTGNDGSITGITVTGSSALNYQWNFAITPTADLTNSVSGNYVLAVTDAFGCNAFSGPHVIGSVGGPTINTTNIVLTNASCLGNDGAISGITTTGGIAAVSWNAGAYSTLDISGIPGGLYILMVTDTSGCTVSVGPYPIGQAAGPSISTAGMVTVNETCGNANGSITGITATGNSLTYQWNGNTTPGADLTSISAGNYTLVVTDNSGCTATAGPFAVINSPAPTLNTTGIVITDEHCANASGSISGIQISGGTALYTVSWNSGAYTTLDISGLSAGSYNLLVSDANGCTTTAGPFVIATISGPAISTAAMVITPESCAGNDGSITGITVSGNSALTYQWNGINAPGADLINVPAGNYTLLATDAFGCTATSGPHSIGGAVVMTLDSSNIAITPAGCTINNGAINGLIVLGGVNPTVLWSNNSTTTSISGLASGIYTITVTDDQSCTITADFNVGMTAGPVVSVNNVVTTPEHCGNNDGAISGITVSGGTPSYTYQWDGSVTQNTLNLTGTNSGNHQLTVTDAVGCIGNASVDVFDVPGPVINENNLIIATAHCGNSDGAITGLAVIGNAPFTYAWTTTTTTSLDLTNLSAGTYTLTVTDPFGCTAAALYNVPTTPTPVADFTFLPDDPEPGEPVVFTDISSGATIANWTWNVNTTQNAGSGPVVSYASPTEGMYTMTLIVNTADGCTASIMKTVLVAGKVVVPNVITRNNDGVNDVFLIQNLPEKSHLIILNRWGNVVFETNDYQNNWRGTDQVGEMLSEGVYTYRLINTGSKAWQGFVHLLNQ